MEKYKEELLLNPDNTQAKEMIEYYESFAEREIEKENDPAWQKNNMEYDLRTSKHIVEKVRNREEYAQNLYAAMCNNGFIRNETWNILKDEENWGASWRYAGGIIANMRGEGDYIDWYCSGIHNDWTDEEFNNATKESQERYLFMKTKFVGEGHITDEVRQDLLEIGWLPHNGDFETFEDSEQ